jgi:signal transduction histidine kinase/integral membrane sensor domain MASE1
METTLPVDRTRAPDSAVPLSGSLARLRSGFERGGPYALLFVAYYVGSQVGLALRFPPATTSVLWPPNAILTAALLLTPPRRWWGFLAAALPAHVLAQHSMEWPTVLVLLLFGTNCLEAVGGASIVRALGGHREPLSTLERTGAFILGAVVLGPFLSGFVDAALVAALRGESYWGVWQTRFYSNVATELTVAATVVVAVTSRRSWLHAAPIRYAEGVLVAICLVTVGLLLFANPGSGVASPEIQTSVVLFLPVLLWSAARFGPGGTALALLAMALLGIGSATAGHRPFALLPPAQSARAYQVFLALVGVPMLCLASLLEEKRAAEQVLRSRLRYKLLLNELSGTFVHLPSNQMDRAFEAALSRVGEFLGAESAVLFRNQPPENTLHTWRARPEFPNIVGEVGREYAWSLGRLGRQESMVVSRVEDLPAAAADEIALVRSLGVRSFLVVPLIVGDRVIGGIAFASITGPREWAPDVVEGLSVVGEVVASALARKETEDALRASEAMKSAILGSLSSRVCVLDREGRLIVANDNWLGGSEPAPLGGKAAIGDSYLEALRAETTAGRAAAWEALVGVRSVVDGAASGYTLEYGAGDGPAEAWFALSVVPLLREGGGAVVSHTEVTERKRAEDEAQRSQRDLAHSLRVSTMGALAASFAHELNQPLTAILANAQAARMRLDHDPPDLHELRDILSDMIDDDRRAGEIIRRSRDLLKKGVSERAPVDVNSCVREVARLLHGDAIIRKVALRFDLQSTAPLVHGDKVQLQQVVLNLVLNAMEAMSGGAPETRQILVATSLLDPETVRISVRDNGPGIPSGQEDAIFEAFHSTKAAGMGMGLSIARSMIQAHGGALHATNNPEGGATFACDLPCLDR